MRARGLLVAVILAAYPAAASSHVPNLSYVPDAILLSPGPRYASNPIGGFPIHVEGTLGPVAGSFVEVEISADAERLISWCRAPYGGPTGQVHPILTGFTDANGNVTFEFYGGGCIDPAAFLGTAWIAQVRADGIVLNEPYVVSPDVVDHAGRKCTDEPPPGGTARCDPDGPDPGTEPEAAVTLADAVFHTPPIQLGLRERCTKFTPPFSGAVGVADAVFLTPYVQNGHICNCQ